MKRCALRRHLVPVLAVVLLTACVQSAPARQPEAPLESLVRVRFGSDITSLDPAQLFGVESQTVANHIYNGLLRYNEQNNQLEPDLAERWEIADGGLRYTFHLRRGVAWHKGYGELSADDVLFSIERVRDPATNSRYAGEFGNISRVEALDAATLLVVLKQPDSGFLHKLAAFAQGMIVSRRAVIELGERYPLSPIGTGPFTFERYIPNDRIELMVNPNYFAGPSAIDHIIFSVIKDEATAEIALRNGEIDIFFGLQSPDIIERLGREPAIVVYERPANNTVNLVLNTRVAPLDQLKVRQAIAHALNRPGLIDGFFRKLKTPADTVLTPSFADYSTKVPTYAYDPARARALLAEANVAPFELPITSVALYPYDQIVVPIADDLRRVGINASITILDRAAYNEARASGNSVAVITAIVGPPDPQNPLWKLYHSSSFPPGLNSAYYSGVDDLLKQAQAEPDAQRRAALYAEVQRQAMSDLPVIPLYTERLFLAARARVQELTQNSLFTLNLYPVKLQQ